MGRGRGPGYYEEGGVWVPLKSPQPQRRGNRSGGTFNSTAFRDKPQRDDPAVTNTYFNSGKEDADKHGHVKHRDNPDGTTDYLFARDVEGNEYEV